MTDILHRDASKPKGRAPKPRRDVIAALDIGGAKIACVIAEVGSRAQPSALRVLGVGCAKSRGVRHGAIIDMQAAEADIRAAVGAAERMAGAEVRDVFVAVNGGRLMSRTFGVEVCTAGHGVTESDLALVFARAREASAAAGRETIFFAPTTFALDGARNIKDPRGLVGEQLLAAIHAVSAEAGALQTIRACVERCHLKVAQFVPAPLAAGRASLAEDEMELGVACIDLGAGATTVSVFQYGAFSYCDMIPVGGAHVTNDICVGLSTSLEQAERLKIINGSALHGPFDDIELIDAPPIAGAGLGDEPQAPRANLTKIISARLEETFELLAQRMADANALDAAGERLVLTGGASQLTGVRELAQRVLQKKVRLGRPIRTVHCPEAATGPAFSVAIGVLEGAAFGMAQDAAWSQLCTPKTKAGSKGVQIGKISAWLKEHF